MNPKLIKLTSFLAVLAFSILACTLPGSGSQSDLGMAQTSAAETVEAQLTRIAENASPTASSTFAPPTSPPATQTPTATLTPLPTATPKPTQVVVPCNWAQYIADVTVLDETTFTINTAFTKTWRLKNIGSCTWSKDYEMVFHSGDKLGGSSLVALPKSVAPGGTVDVSVGLKAPDKAGEYISYWLLRSSNGSQFGLGGGADKPFWVEINVVGSNPAYRYDFAANICQATWRDSDGKIPCQGTSAAGGSYVMLTDSPRLENGNREDELTLVMNVAKEDKVAGSFPDFTVEDGDHFVAWIGCLYDSETCKAEFVLSYRVIGTSGVTQLGSWTEKYNGKLTKIDVDLSSLAGEKVEFILTVRSKTSSNDNQVLWFVPGIKQ